MSRRHLPKSPLAPRGAGDVRGRGRRGVRVGVLALAVAAGCGPAAGTAHPRPGEPPGETRGEERAGPARGAVSARAAGARPAGALPVLRFRPRWTLRSFPGHPRIEAAVVDHVNALRKRLGLRPLRPDPRLTAAARQHTREMLARGYYAHASPVSAWQSPRQRACHAGYLDPFVSENIGLVSGYADVARALFDSWRRSPGHYQNMVNPESTRIGVGVARGVRGGRPVWLATQVFGALPIDLRNVSVHPVRRAVLRVEARFRARAPVQVTVWSQKQFRGRIAPGGAHRRSFRYHDDLPLPLGGVRDYHFAVTTGRRTPLVCAELRVAPNGRVRAQVVDYAARCRVITGFRATAKRLRVTQSMLSFEVRRGDVAATPAVRLFLNRVFGPAVRLAPRGWTRVTTSLPETAVVQVGMVVDRLEKQYLVLERRGAPRFRCP